MNVFESLRDYFVHSKGQDLAKQFQHPMSSLFSDSKTFKHKELKAKIKAFSN